MHRYLTLVAALFSTGPAFAASSDITLAELSQSSKAVCGNTGAGQMRCHAQVRLTNGGQTFADPTPSGFGATDLRAAYNITGNGGAGVTVAIVDAHDDPNAEADFNVYRQQYGLPPCTAANGCFRKINQDGQASPLPTPDAGWASEISLDLDMASAACPACNIVLVEANTPTTNDLGAAVNAAVAAGANVVSNSYGGSEDSTITAADQKYFNHPGVAIFASSGDAGYGAQYPASSAYVTAVGGTSLTQDATGASARGWSESAWNSGGSGCSAFISKPSWQNDPSCAFRTVVDLSAVADPATGVAVYITYGDGNTGWSVYGGTSAASPLVAAIYAATGNAGADNSFAYSHTGAFYDVSSGFNGVGNSYLCESGVGYSGPTGWGTPNAAVLANNGAGGGGLAPQPAPPASASSPCLNLAPPTVVLDCHNGGAAWGWLAAALVLGLRRYRHSSRSKRDRSNEQKGAMS